MGPIKTPPARGWRRRLQMVAPWVEFALDTPLEGDGFESSVPLWRMAPGPASAELREVGDLGVQLRSLADFFAALKDKYS